MNFNDHSKLLGEHAFLSASKYSWVNYDEDRLRQVYASSQAAALGTRLHELAAEHISLGIRLPRSSATLNQYVNDAIGYHMTPEQVLVYSLNAFGTADAIRYDEKKHFLRIHDLKTGVTRASIKQLEIYQALFCLEYGIRPFDISSELRLYQNDEVIIHVPEPADILQIMDKIIAFDKVIESMKEDAR